MKGSSSTQKPTNTSNGSTAKGPFEAASGFQSYIEAFGTKELAFRFRGRDYFFLLSHGLFSSADIDTGSRFLLKVFSRFLDDTLKNGGPFPGRILDAGSGAGVLGICAAGALKDARAAGFRVRAQDRDELGRVFTEHNARRNGFGEDFFEARTEPLLAGNPENVDKPEARQTGEDEPRWDLVLSNVPAKAGLPVLEDFVRRSAAMLGRNGRVLVVVVNTLAPFFEEKIKSLSYVISKDEGPEHTVFLYGHGEAKPFFHEPFVSGSGGLVKWNPAYLRNSTDYEIEKTSYHLDTVYGAESFDECGGETEAAAKLAARLEEQIRSSLRLGQSADAAASVLIWEGDQGHFSTWFSRRFLAPEKAAFNFVLAGRNILALEAAKSNTVCAISECSASKTAAVPAADLFLDREKLFKAAGRNGFAFLAAFPKAVPQTDRNLEFWEGLAFLAAPGAVIIVSLPSTAAERFDRKKPKSFTRIADIRRDGFRALAYKS